MNVNVGHIRNPLTIIAVFAALAESCSIAVLPFLPMNIQVLYVWFVIFFPVLLVFLFFFTLFKRPWALYGPSDFKDDDSFLTLHSHPDPNAGIEKSKEEAVEGEKIIEKDLSYSVVPADTSNLTTTATAASIVGSYRIVEDLVFGALNNRLNKNFIRTVPIDQPIKFTYDGVLVNGSEVSFVEIKYYPKRFNWEIIENILTKSQLIFNNIEKNEKKKSSLILALVFDSPMGVTNDEFIQKFELFLKRNKILEISKSLSFSYPLLLKFYKFDPSKIEIEEISL